MTFNIIVVIIVCAVFGYWVVGSLIGVKKDENNTHQTNPNSSKNTQNNHDHYQKQKKHDANSNSSRSSQDNHQQYQKQKTHDARSNEDDYVKKSWFRILEVLESDDKATIATAYKKKISQYHPDKVATMGPELRELAEFKSKQINTAYDYALTLRS